MGDWSNYNANTDRTKGHVLVIHHTLGFVELSATNCLPERTVRVVLAHNDADSLAAYLKEWVSPGRRNRINYRHSPDRIYRKSREFKVHTNTMGGHDNIKLTLSEIVHEPFMHAAETSVSVYLTLAEAQEIAEALRS